MNPGDYIQGAGHAEEAIINSLAPDEEIGHGEASRNFCLKICYKKLNVRGMQFWWEGYFVGVKPLRVDDGEESGFTLYLDRDEPIEIEVTP